MPNISEIRTGIDGNQTVDYDDGTTKVEVPVRFDKVTGELTSNAGAVYSPVKLISGAWTFVPSISRLRVQGSGTLSIDSRDRSGTVSVGVFSNSYSLTQETIEFPYYGDSAVQIRASFSNTLTIEVI